MFIYKITNLANGKSYVGQTVFSIEARFARHCGKHKTAISQAIAKYGKANFKLELLETVKTCEELNNREHYYIELHNTVAPSGYNLKSGGNQKVKFSEETKLKMRQSHKHTKTFLGKQHTLEARAKISQNLQGNTPWNYGKPQTVETKQKLRLAMLGKVSPNKGKALYKVIGPDVEFKSITEAAQFYKVTNQAIILRCKRNPKWKLEKYETKMD